MAKRGPKPGQPHKARHMGARKKAKPLGLCQCRDPATKTFRGKVYCDECFNEIFSGAISLEPAKLGFGRGGN